MEFSKNALNNDHKGDEKRKKEREKVPNADTCVLKYKCKILPLHETISHSFLWNFNPGMPPVWMHWYFFFVSEKFFYLLFFVGKFY